MTTEKKVILTAVIIIAIIALFYGIKSFVSVFKNNERAQPKPETKPVVTLPGQDSSIGKIAYAKEDGTMVMDSDFNIYKFAKKDEWVGTVYGVGENNYIVSGNRYVLKADVYLVQP